MDPLLQDFARRGGVVDYVRLRAQTHREAAISTLARLGEPGQPERAVGWHIPLVDFLGPGYDWQRDCLTQSLGEGYAYAFAEPPYSLRGSPAEIDALFGSINEDLFGPWREELVVYQWSTDWSAYFEPGLEWWGAFLWTVRIGAGEFVGVAASSTD